MDTLVFLRLLSVSLWKPFCLTVNLSCRLWYASRYISLTVRYIKLTLITVTMLLFCLCFSWKIFHPQRLFLYWTVVKKLVDDYLTLLFLSLPFPTLLYLSLPYLITRNEEVDERVWPWQGHLLLCRHPSNRCAGWFLGKSLWYLLSFQESDEETADLHLVMNGVPWK